MQPWWKTKLDFFGESGFVILLFRCGTKQNANGSYTIYEAGYQVWFSKQIYPACSNHFVEMATIGEWWCAESIDDRLALPRGAWQFRCPGARSRSNGYVTQACSLSKAVIPITQKNRWVLIRPSGLVCSFSRHILSKKLSRKNFLCTASWNTNVAKTW